jgi:endonuclease YncB( thermonuclease family)
MRKPSEFENHPAPFPAAAEFRGFCHHVVDGDTLDVFVDLGFLQYAYVTVRLADVDTPEIFGTANVAERTRGLAAKKRLEELILQRPVLLRTRRDKTTFGRFVAEVYYGLERGERLSAGDALRAEGMAK